MCVCVCVSEIQEIFFCGAGSEREGEMGAYDNQSVRILYSVCTQHDMYVQLVVLAGAGIVLDIICRQKLKRQENRTEISVLLSLSNGAYT